MNAPQQHQHIDWSQLPARFAYLQPLAEKYGGYDQLDEKEAFVRQLTVDQREVLEAALDYLLAHDHDPQEWIDKQPVDDPAATRLGSLLDVICLAFDGVPVEPPRQPELKQS